MIDLFHIDKMAPLDISWEQKNVERDLSTSLNIQRTFTDFARTSPTWPPKLSTAVKKLGWSNIWRRYFPFPCNVFLCGSGRCSKSDFPSNWVRQRAQRTLHGQFPGPQHLPKDQTCPPHQIAQLSIFTFETLISRLKTRKKLGIGWHAIHIYCEDKVKVELNISVSMAYILGYKAKPDNSNITR